MRLEWADHDEHQCLAVATQRILQQVCQLNLSVRSRVCSRRRSYLAVAIRHMPAILVLSERTNDVSETAQALVDVLRLFHPLARRTRVAQSLTARQIDQVQGAFGVLARD